MHDSGPKPDVPPQRLCSEVQLFDLCDLDTCVYKNGRFCADPALLDRFEKIAEDELRPPDRYVSEECDDAEAEDSDGYGYDDEAAMEDFEGGEDGAREDEE
jgi:hypothetical protein